MDQLYGKAEDFFREQVAEAWSFYRHLETQRFQYVALFFTVFGTGVGFVVSLLTSKDRPGGPGTLFGVSVITALLFCFSVLIYVVVVRLNIVLDFYGSVMAQTRSYFFGNSGYASATWDYSTVGLHPTKARLFGVQRAITTLVGFLSISIAMAHVIVTVVLIKQLSWRAWRSELDLAMSIAMFVVLVPLFVLAKRERDYHFEARNRRHTSAET